jgi:putative oxidoreductase
MRLVAGASLIVNGIEKLQAGEPLQSVVLDILAIGVGALLVAGIWTPVAGFSVFVLALLDTFARHGNLTQGLLLATIGLALALVGPGAWSWDARLFGWKRIDIER